MNVSETENWIPKRKILSGYREYIFHQDDHIERDIYNERDYIAFGQCKYVYTML